MSAEEDKLKASNGDILVPNNNLYPTEIDINASKVSNNYMPSSLYVRTKIMPFRGT